MAVDACILIGSSANENAQRLNKKTIQPKDVLDALADLEFAAFVPRCEGELQKYNTVQCDKRNTYRRRVKEEAKTKDGEDGQPGSEPGSAGAQDPTLASEESGANRNNAPGEASSWSEPASAGAARSPLGASASPGEPSSKRARGPTGVATSAAEEDDIDEDADMDETLEDMDDEDEDEESDHDDNDDGEDDQADGQQEPEGDTIDDMDMDNNDAAVMDESDDSVDSDDPAGTNPEEDEDD